MDTHNHHIDDFFKNELGKLEIAPPDSVWLNIEQKLDKKRKVRILIYRLGMAAGLALFTGLGSLYLNNTKPANMEVAVNTKETDQIKTTGKLNSENRSINNENINAQNIAFKNNPEQIKKDNNLLNEGEKIQINSVKNENRLVADNKLPEDVTNSKEYDTHQPETISYLQPKKALLTYNRDISPDENLISNSYNPQPVTVAEPLVANNDIKPKRHRWSIEAQFAPQYSYRALTGSSAITNKSAYKETEEGLLAYNGALKVNFEATRRLTIQAGAAFSIMGQTLKNLYEIRPDNDNNKYKMAEVKRFNWVNNSLGLIVDDSENTIYNIPISENSNQVTFFNTLGIADQDGPVKAPSNDNSSISSLDSKIIQQLKVIEIPILARYKIIDRRVDWHILGGFSTNILIGSDALFKEGDTKNKLGKTIGLKPYNYIGTAGFGISYSLTRRISIQVEPTFKYYLNYLAETNGYRYHPYSYAVFTGVRYQF